MTFFFKEKITIELVQFYTNYTYCLLGAMLKKLNKTNIIRHDPISRFSFKKIIKQLPLHSQLLIAHGKNISSAISLMNCVIGLTDSDL